MSAVDTPATPQPSREEDAITAALKSIVLARASHELMTQALAKQCSRLRWLLSERGMDKWAVDAALEDLETKERGQ